MLALDRLPNVTFVRRDGAHVVVDLPACEGKIAAISKHLAESLELGSTVGLLYASEPDLLINWIACVHAGLKPLILQFPNNRQNAKYWMNSVQNTVDLVGLKTIISNDRLDDTKDVQGVRYIRQYELEGLPERIDQISNIPDFEIIQLSSGTTGFRKAIKFDDKSLVIHIEAFNRTLNLGEKDAIVSWLPLYHDMGFIACFVMPLMLGVDIFMIDPIEWVSDPILLFETIERFRATICYMPNFGFEVMSRQPVRDLSSIRLWISCSEPISRRTAQKFLDHVQSTEDRFACCYAMAENIFAISFGVGVRGAAINGVDVVSCGPPIGGVKLKVVDGQIWAKSPTSLRSYIGGDDVCDDEGYYPTGDLGELIDGELYVSGRKHDLLIQAGRKFLLSDIDLRVNELLPEVKGRVAALALRDSRLETEIACVLIESWDFYNRNDQAEVELQLRSLTGIDQLSVHFVPPRFLTKTTSGKINRKQTLSDWMKVEERTSLEGIEPARELELMFRSVPWNQPVSEILDSLSTTIVQMILSDAGLDYRPEDSLDAIRDKLAKQVDSDADAADRLAFRIVSLAERLLFDDLSVKHLEAIGNKIGRRVTFEHVCVPPSPVLLSDLIFNDYFGPRLDPAHMAAVSRALQKIRSADAIILDDASELFYLPEQIYGALSHNMERDPRTDLISVRWQRYSQFHDLLPLTVVRGGDIALSDVNRSTEALGDYLKVPIFRIANFRGFDAFTQGWEWRPLRGTNKALDPSTFVEAFCGRLVKDKQDAIRPGSYEPGRVDLSDAIHFCSHAINKDVVDSLLEHFDRICVAGGTASVPYIRRRLAELGRPLVYIPSYAPEIVESVKSQVDVILICGAMGDFELRIPAVALQHVGQGWRTKNLEAYGEKFAHLNVHGTMEDAPESGNDWFFQGDLVWGRGRDEWVSVRMASARGELG